MKDKKYKNQRLMYIKKSFTPIKVLQLNVVGNTAEKL